MKKLPANMSCIKKRPSFSALQALIHCFYVKVIPVALGVGVTILISKFCELNKELSFDVGKATKQALGVGITLQFDTILCFRFLMIC